MEAVKEQLTREPYPFPTVQILKELRTIEDIENLTFDDFSLIGYQSHPGIKAKIVT